MARILAICLFCLPSGIAAASVSSCGGPTDHLSNVVISLSPDPIAKGQPFTFTLAGTLDEDLVGGSLFVDLQVKALDVINKAVQKSVNYTVTPGIAKGDVKIVVGPVTLPNDPGGASFIGKVQLTDPEGLPVACIALDLQVPLEERPQEALPAASHQGSQSCGKPTDHLTNIAISTQGQVTTMTATLDEDLPTISCDVDLTVKALFVTLPLKLTIPVSISPALPKGDWKLVSQSSSVAPTGRGAVSVTGQVVVNDAQGQEVACVSVQDAELQGKAVII